MSWVCNMGIDCSECLGCGECLELDHETDDFMLNPLFEDLKKSVIRMIDESEKNEVK